MLIYDLAEIILCGLIIRKALGRIANIVDRPTSSIRHVINAHVANCVERQVDITRTQTTGRTDLCRIGLIEYVEEPGPELELLRLAEIEVLKERNVEIAPARCSQVKRRLRRSSVGERWNLKGVEIE